MSWRSSPMSVTASRMGLALPTPYPRAPGGPVSATHRSSPSWAGRSTTSSGSGEPPAAASRGCGRSVSGFASAKRRFEQGDDTGVGVQSCRYADRPCLDVASMAQVRVGDHRDAEVTETVVQHRLRLFLRRLPEVDERTRDHGGGVREVPGTPEVGEHDVDARGVLVVVLDEDD